MPIDTCDRESASMTRQGPWHVSQISTVAAAIPEPGYEMFMKLKDALPGIWGIANQGTALFAIGDRDDLACFDCADRYRTPYSAVGWLAHLCLSAEPLGN
jgi:hypothetical protein